MKKMLGLVALSVIGLAVAAWAQAPAAVPVATPAPASAVASVEATATAAAEAVAPVVEAAATAVESAVAGEITVKGKVSVVTGADGALQAIYINPMDSHGYKVDLVNGEGKALTDKGGKIVEVIGVDVNRLLNVKTITVVE